MGYNNNSKQNQSVFQTIAKNLLGISSANILNSPMNPFHRSLRGKLKHYNSKLLLIPTVSMSRYHHTSWKTKSVLQEQDNMS